MVLYPASTGADSPLAHKVVHPLQLALVVLFHPPTGANTALALGQLALCGGGLCGGIKLYIIFANLLISKLAHWSSLIRECGSTLYVGMAQGVSLSLYIGIGAKFENTQKTGERRLRTAEYRTVLL